MHLSSGLGLYDVLRLYFRACFLLSLWSQFLKWKVGLCFCFVFKPLQLWGLHNFLGKNALSRPSLWLLVLLVFSS